MSTHRLTCARSTRSRGLAARAGATALLLPFALVPAALAQAGGPATSAPGPAQPPPFKLFRYDEDYTYLADPARRGHALDDLKYMALSADGTVSLSIGGEARSRYEHTSAPFFGLRSPGHDDFFLQRLLLHADLRIGDRTGVHGRVFVQLLSGLVTGEELPKTGIQDNLLDVQQAFADVIWGDNRPAATGKGGSSLAIRAGRQEIGLGSFRLVTIREPTNARLAFDGVRATLHAQGLTFDGFLFRPTDQKIGLFNDGQDDNTTFWGVHGVAPLAPDRRLGLDLYYLGLKRERTRFQSGTGNELRHSVGARIWGRADGWDHDTEAVLQFGTFDLPGRSQDILAWTVASNTGYTFEHALWQPRLGLKLNVASGDSDPADGRLGTFNPLFPRNNYFNDANLLAPYNFFDFHPTITVKPADNLTIGAGVDSYFRYETGDAVYSPTGIVIPAGASDDRYVGTSLALTADWAINRHLALTLSYTHFFKGQVVKDAGGRDVDYFGASLTAKF
jgi:hypothetical protein